ncbi:MAG: hypothetical protein J6X18_03665, partial [Bacteroidales bacterium]|nr:hypothetical protein [Bacteroidales bacterium]
MAENERKTYRIRTAVGNEAPASINVNLTQTYDVVDVLSLELNQKNFYKMPAAGYGVILGRVIANGGFGIPNAKVSVFIPYDSNLLFEENNFLYRFGSPASKDSEGIRYNLLPRRVDDDCHQDVGTMPEKEYLLDNKDLIQVFDKYYKYTAVTNEAGDYFIYGVPVGTQTVHVDLDLSDIGVLSQRPRDMIYKGYNINQFESPNKFKKDKNLNSLAPIFTQDKVVTVYSFWGDTSEDPTVGTLTRCDISIDYKFEPTCVFMGSIVSDTGNRAISQRCVPDDEIGKMSELVTGEGKIEMIRKTFDGKVEEFSVKGNNLIDGDGVWCYQIPMNLDYVVTDEFGNMVPTDNPEKGIATRTRDRFRISMNETENDETARKRARFLVPNNPKLTEDYPDFKKSHKADYEFGTFTKEESYRDLFWNKVYTVKSYIPRLQKAKAMRRRVHTGIKNVNHAGANNPFPFNNLFIRLTFLYRFLCVLLKRFCVLGLWVNNVLGVLGYALYYLARFNIFLEKIVLFGSDENYGYILNPIGKIIKKISQYFDEAELPVLGHPLQYIAKLLLNAVEHLNVKLDNFCDDGNFTNQPYYLGTIKRYKDLFTDPDKKVELPDIGYSFPEDTMITNWIGNGNVKLLFNCIENQLVQDQECTSFNFNNDWVNGVLYAPMWYRKVRSKKRILFNLIPIKAKDKWCNGEAEVPTVFNKLSLCQTCAQRRAIANDGLSLLPLENDIINRPYSSPTNFNKDSVCYGYKCHKKTVSFITINKGLIIPKETILGENVYYYKAVEYDESHLMSQEKPDEKGDVKMLFATDIVLLGSLNECDSDGVPQFFKTLESTTYNMPPDLLLMDYESNVEKLKYEPKYTDSDTSEDETEIGIGDEGLENILEDFNDIASIDNISNVYTDKTGADWGNYGRDQVVNPSDNTSIIY